MSCDIKLHFTALYFQQQKPWLRETKILIQNSKWTIQSNRECLADGLGNREGTLDIDLGKQSSNTQSHPTLNIIAIVIIIIVFKKYLQGVFKTTLFTYSCISRLRLYIFAETKIDIFIFKLYNIQNLSFTWHCGWEESYQAAGAEESCIKVKATLWWWWWWWWWYWSIELFLRFAPVIFVFKDILETLPSGVKY